MTQPLLSVRFSKQFELERIRQTIEKLDWYRRQGYAILVPQRLNETSTDAEVTEAIESEFDESVYQEAKKNLEAWWSTSAQSFLQTLGAIIPSQPEHIEIKLTRYGTAGSYNEPRTIVLNIASQTKRTIPQRVQHELIHLAIEPLVQTFALDHWSKEQLVDLLFNAIESDHVIVQRHPQNADCIQHIFETHNPNIEKIAEEISKRKTPAVSEETMGED